MPTRLVDVGASGTDQSIHLCESSAIPPGTPYATLSHRWGSKQFFCLLRENQPSLETEIPFSKLRKVFQDAIQLTRSIGIRYLWIDSLCIIQDSDADWTREAGMMSTVYANGTCNLAATGDVDGAKGLFADRQPSLLQPIVMEIDEDIYFEGELAFRKGQYLVVGADIWKEGVEDAPLNQRGWVMQERMLSPRSLHFGARQIFWECYEMEACEVFPTGLPGQMHRANAKKLLSALSSVGPWNHSATGHPINLDVAEFCRLRESRRQWYQIVNAYTERHLTRQSDKLIAIAGLAAVMRDILGSRYLAGLWEDNLIKQLSWGVHSSQIQPRPLVSRCPSWSWASVDSRVSMPDWRIGDDRFTALASIIKASVTPVGHNELGAIEDGFLILTGRLGIMRLYQDGEFVPRDYKYTTIDSWIDDDIFLDAIDTEYPDFGRKRVIAFQVVEAGSLDLASMAAENLSCFFMPIAFHQQVDRWSARVSGLLLLPTGSTPGEYRRIGLFRAYLKHSIAKVKGPLGTIGPAHFMSRTGEGTYTICIR